MFPILLLVILVYSGFCCEMFSQLEILGSSCMERSGIKIHTVDVTLRKANRFTVLLLVDKQTKKNQYGRSLALTPSHSLLAEVLLDYM